MKVKICGITNIPDALAAAASGADYLGFVFHPRSPRYVSPATVSEIAAALPSPRPELVGVFVNPAPAELRAILEQCPLDIIQLHGDEDPGFAVSLSPRRVWKAWHLDSEDQLPALNAFPAAAIVVDSRSGQQRGGTGVVCDWSLAARAAAVSRIFLAGGITPDNAVNAANTVKPFGLDLSSGVESSPGIKNHDAIRLLFENLKHANIR